MSMPSVPITVEHPQYTQTLVVHVPPTATVSDIKQEISRECPGNPRVEGQRLISKGRVLDDGECVETLWTSEDLRVVHLAVNPLSWSSNPPNVTVVDDSTSTAFVAYSDLLQRRAQATETPVNNIPNTPPVMLPQFETLPFISHLHHKALRALSPSTPPAAPGADDSLAAKEYAKTVLQASNYPWPEIFDAEFPTSTNGGVAYEFTLIGGKPFLQNLTPYATPTPRQQHALNVLSYTFPLLTFAPARPQAIVNSGNGTTPNANIINNLNGGPPRPDANVRNVIAVRVNMRELLTPLILLFIRTLILLYFFSPARKPVFGILLGAYVLYEAWGAVRGAVFDVGPLNGNDPGARDRRRRARPGNEDAPPPPAPGAIVPPHQNPGAAAAANLEAGIDHLAQMSLDTEARWLENGAPEPSLFYKVTSFVMLLVLSIHPAFWNRRRMALRTREGRVRTEANALEAAVAQQAEGEEGGAGDERARLAREQMINRLTRRPVWIREYVERVRRGEWVDD
ncbi:uncharacterized protein FOMMEDRAFT_169182, partial [Fomitiporia mediterranea MF3/22]|uniref:uncharacterized protein n=1 Tax=Fomitiporia mediterranea (strain MF3/22) TaxID=694068 RepID=UPI00044082F3